jgi:SHS2 domain-containing protein
VTVEVFEHTADLGLRIRAATLESLFAEAGAALFSVLVANPDSVACVQEKTFHVPGREHDYLLFDWLSELLYTFETERLLLANFDVQIDEHGLHALCRGEPIDRQRHDLDHEVKAITYHELKVRATDAGWLAEVIVDI